MHPSVIGGGTRGADHGPRSEPRGRGSGRTLKQGGATDPGKSLSFVAADLEADAGWPEAAQGCDYVLHVASPFPSTQPRNEDELIVPAREGALRVLKAARDAKVKRVVLTSSFAAIGYGHDDRNTPFDETVWTAVKGKGVSAYAKSKTIAERAAWDFVEHNGGGLELAVVNPVGVFGRLLGPDYSTSIILIKRLMDGGVPGCPRIYFGAVDVRDVADLHIRAMTDPAAKGQRFLAVAGPFMSMVEMSQTLKAKLGDAARRAPTGELPDILLQIMALWDGEVRQLVPELGKHKDASSAKAERMLGWSPRSAADSIVATAESLIAMGLVKG